MPMPMPSETGTVTPLTGPDAGMQRPGTAAPGPGGALQQLIAVLAQAFAPKGLTQHKAVTDQAIGDASGGGSLGSQF